MINYWLDLFTGKTWEEFLNSGGSISGFRKNRYNIAKKVKVGDYLICYLTGISRFIGVLEIESNCYFDESKIWEDETFPVRFKVKILYKLTPKTAIPVKKLKEKLSIFQNLKSEHAWSGFFRGSPAKFNVQDGQIIVKESQKDLTLIIEGEFKKILKADKETCKKIKSFIKDYNSEREVSKREEIKDKIFSEISPGKKIELASNK